MASGSQDYWDVTTGGLLAKLDALDGTMDGRLTLTQLNASLVKTNLDDTVTNLATSIARLESIISQLSDQLTQQTAIAGSTSKREYAGYAKLDTTGYQLIDASTNHVVTVWSHPENTDGIYLVHAADPSGTPFKTLAVGQIFCDAPDDNPLSARAVSGTQYLGMHVTGY